MKRYLSSLVFILLLFPIYLSAQVSYDNTATSSRLESGGAPPLTFNLTVNSVAGGGYITVDVAVGRDTAATENVTVTIGGNTATILCTTTSDVSAEGGIRKFGLINNSTGSVPIAVSWDFSPDLEVGAISYKGVHQTVPTGTCVTAHGHDTTPTVGVTDSVSGDMVNDGIVHAGASQSSTSSQTERWDVCNNSVSSGGCGAGATAAGASGTVTMSHTITADDWGILAVAIKQAGGGSPAVAPKLTLMGVGPQ